MLLWFWHHNAFRPYSLVKLSFNPKSITIKCRTNQTKLLAANWHKWHFYFSFLSITNWANWRVTQATNLQQPMTWTRTLLGTCFHTTQTLWRLQHSQCYVCVGPAGPLHCFHKFHWLGKCINGATMSTRGKWKECSLTRMTIENLVTCFFLGRRLKRKTKNVQAIKYNNLGHSALL